MLGGLAPSSQTVGSKIGPTPWATKLVRKMAKCEFGKFTTMEKYNQLLLAKFAIFIILQSGILPKQMF
jgi:hypothetical protein